MRFPNRFFSRTLLAILISIFAVSAFPTDQYPKKPLNKREVVALVAGAVLPESIAADIKAHGLNFRPSQQYLSRFAQVGADPVVLDALKKANVMPNNADSHPDDDVVLEHLFIAAEKLRAKKLMDAATEIAAASDRLEDHPELAFVMADILLKEEGFTQAGLLLSQLVEIDPEFPEVHTKLSFVLYRYEDSERGVAEARAALARTPDNAEAHKNMGLNLQALKQYDAAVAEYRKALAIKPDYTFIHLDLGTLYYDRGDYRNAIAEERKALAFDSGSADAHYDLASALQKIHEYGPAISEFREAIRLKPTQAEWRMSLAFLLEDSGDKEGGVEEFRKLIRMSPDSSYCHSCFGSLLLQADRIDEAEREYRTALQLDPADLEAHYGLGRVFWSRNQLDQALKEYLQATKFGLDSWQVHLQLARIYLARKQNDDALREIKQSVSLSPSNSTVHQVLADILVASGRIDDAILEYRQANGLLDHGAPEESDIDRKMAILYEQRANYAESLVMYRAMYDSFPNEKNKAEYEAARNRLSPHLPKSAFEQDSANSDPRVLATRWMEESREMQAAMAEKLWKDADAKGQEVIALAEQMQPQDARLVSSIDMMGQNYAMQNRSGEAEQQYLKAAQVSEKLLGTSDLQTMYALSALGQFYFQMKNYPQAVEYLTRSFEVAQKLYGPTYGYELLDLIGQAYQEQRIFDKAEDAYRRMLSADEAKNGPSSPSSAPALEHLGVLYCDMKRYEDARGSLERALAIDQEQFGPNSPGLGRPLNELARALRGLGKEDEAKAIDQRRQLLAQTHP